MTQSAPPNPASLVSPGKRSYLQRVLSSLRANILLAILVVLALLLLFNAILIQQLMLPGFRHVEEQRVLIDLERINQTLQAQAEQLDRVTQAWASWDDTYAFMKVYDQDFADRNLSVTFFQQYDINVILMVDTAQQVVYSKYYDVVNQTISPGPPELERYVLAHPDLLRYEKLDSSHTGILLLPQGALIVAMRPVLNDLGQGPSHGTLLMGRFLDEQKLAAFRRLVELNFSVNDLNGIAKTPDLQIIQDDLRSNGKVLIRPLNNQVIVGYSLIDDIIGQRNVVIRVEQVRDIFLLGQQQSRYLFLALTGGGTLIGIVIVLLIEYLILRRLLKLDRQVEHIGQSNDLALRVHTVGQDELAHLGRSINNMLDSQAHMLEERLRLEEARIHVLERESLLRQTLQAVSTPIIPVLPATFVVPLLGSFDSERVDDLAQVVLNEVYKQRARQVIFDFTGMQVPEARSMQRMMQLIEAVNLLGTKIILVGIGAELAQSLVALDISLGDKHIAANLQTAVMTLVDSSNRVHTSSRQ